MTVDRTEFARASRQRAIEAEARLWSRLRNRQIGNAKFVRQMPIGAHIDDFVCRSARLVIEVDGGQHADSATDERRTHAIEANGYLVLRFRNHEVLGNPEGVLEAIRAAILNARTG